MVQITISMPKNIEKSAFQMRKPGYCQQCFYVHKSRFATATWNNLLCHTRIWQNTSDKQLYM